METRDHGLHLKEEAMSDNDDFIAWIGDRLRYGDRLETPWSPASQEWIRTAGASRPHGDVAPPDVVLAEIDLRLSALGGTYLDGDISK
jgi:hypothetical protein